MLLSILTIACSSTTTTEESATADSTQSVQSTPEAQDPQVDQAAQASQYVEEKPKPRTVVISNQLVVREASGENGQPVDTVYLGDILKLLGDESVAGPGGKRNKYYKVELSDKIVGWVPGEFIAIDVYPAAITQDAVIKEGLDEVGWQNEYGPFKQGDFVVVGEEEGEGGEYFQASGKIAGEDKFTTGYVFGGAVSLDEPDWRYAALKRRAREEVSPEIKARLQKELNDMSMSMSGESDLETEDHAPRYVERREPTEQRAGTYGYYPMNSGGADESFNAHHMRGHGTKLASDGRNTDGRALEFDGNAYMESSGADLEVPFTVAAWFLITTDRPKQTLVSMARSESSTIFNLSLVTIDGTKSAYFGFNAQSSPVGVSSPANLYDNKWHHLAGTYDGKAIKLYVDGSLVAETTLSQRDADGIGFFKSYYANNIIEIGRETTNLDYYFHGNIDDVIVYRTALDADEVKFVYQSGFY